VFILEYTVVNSIYLETPLIKLTLIILAYTFDV
jgi:hypothetical protein